MTETKPRPAAIVTGSSRGIGAAVAERLAAAGHPVTVNYVESAGPAAEVAARIERAGGRTIVVRADVGDRSDLERLVRETVDAFGELAVLVNNAGFSQHRTLDEISGADWDRAVSVNLSAAAFLTQRALPFLRRSPWARVVNICSLRAMIGSDHGSHYAAAKAGLIGLTKSLALELAPTITVNAVSPGYTRTDMTRDVLETHSERIFARIPAGRAAEPREIAALVAFLASEEAGYITGQTININGGIYM
jgi:NAD(P)-dependent dehydrogenase (short-subunit alcohol dehydrogenase family)